MSLSAYPLLATATGIVTSTSRLPLPEEMKLTAPYHDLCCVLYVSSAKINQKTAAHIVNIF